jgi:hypothetical protein
MREVPDLAGRLPAIGLETYWKLVQVFPDFSASAETNKKERRQTNAVEIQSHAKLLGLFSQT